MMQAHVPADIQQEIISTLNLNDAGRLSREQFEFEYKNKHAFLFNFIKMGFTTLRQVFESLDHIVKVESQFGTDVYYVELLKKSTNTKMAKENPSVEKNQVKNNGL